MTDATLPARTKRLPFDGAQLGALIAIGVTLWFAAAILIRFLAPTGALDGASLALVYALVVPGTWPFIPLIAKLARLEKHELALGCSIATAAAMLCDGVALRLIPSLYGGEAYTSVAGALILWGAGVGIVIACFLNRAD